jgi:hypothetical protein
MQGRSVATGRGQQLGCTRRCPHIGSSALAPYRWAWRAGCRTGGGLERAPHCPLQRRPAAAAQLEAQQAADAPPNAAKVLWVGNIPRSVGVPPRAPCRHPARRPIITSTIPAASPPRAPHVPGMHRLSSHAAAPLSPGSRPRRRQQQRCRPPTPPPCMWRWWALHPAPSDPPTPRARWWAARAAACLLAAVAQQQHACLAGLEAHAPCPAARSTAGSRWWCWRTRGRRLQQLRRSRPCSLGPSVCWPSLP